MHSHFHNKRNALVCCHVILHRDFPGGKTGDRMNIFVAAPCCCRQTTTGSRQDSQMDIFVRQLSMSVGSDVEGPSHSTVQKKKNLVLMCPQFLVQYFFYLFKIK